MYMKKVFSLNVGLVLILMVSLADAADPKDLIIHLPFEGNGKEVKDVSPNKFRGKVEGKAKSVEGVVGKALEFGGGAAKFDPLKQEKVSWIVLPTNYQVELANSAWVIKHALIPA